ncbi:MAG: hypothetical protein HC824_00005, partial [Synechococcales cyanobacterium RM1_1_8]|nr:hypothetical protein [Synechococcales cyanobacterium RM1_1_8]
MIRHNQRLISTGLPPLRRASSASLVMIAHFAIAQPIAVLATVLPEAQALDSVKLSQAVDAPAAVSQAPEDLQTPENPQAADLQTRIDPKIGQKSSPPAGELSGANPAEPQPNPSRLAELPAPAKLLAWASEGSAVDVAVARPPLGPAASAPPQSNHASQNRQPSPRLSLAPNPAPPITNREEIRNRLAPGPLATPAQSAPLQVLSPPPPSLLPAPPSSPFPSAGGNGINLAQAYPQPGFMPQQVYGQPVYAPVPFYPQAGYPQAGYPQPGYAPFPTAGYPQPVYYIAYPAYPPQTYPQPYAAQPSSPISPALPDPALSSARISAIGIRSHSGSNRSHARPVPRPVSSSIPRPVPSPIPRPVPSPIPR